MFALVHKGRIDDGDPYAVPVRVGERQFPAVAAVIDYAPAEPPYRGGHPDRWEPGTDEELDWQLFLPDGRPAPKFVHEMVTPHDVEEIESQLMAAIKSAADCY